MNPTFTQALDDMRDAVGRLLDVPASEPLFYCAMCAGVVASDQGDHFPYCSSTCGAEADAENSIDGL